MTAHDAPAGSPAEQPFQTELLFTDGLPQMDDEVGYRGAVAARAAQAQGATAVVAGWDGAVRAVMTVGDAVRPDSAATVARPRSSAGAGGCSTTR